MDIFIAHCHQRFTLSPECPICDARAESVRPQKYSHEDKYGDYRRQALEDERRRKGCL